MYEKTCLIILASGLSRRFGLSNKLVANFSGAPLAGKSAALWQNKPAARKVAVVPYTSTVLEQLYLNKNWTIVKNNYPSAGQSNSLKLGLQKAIEFGAEKVVISLADMPYVCDYHIDRVSKALTAHSAAISKSTRSLSPPAGFDRVHFDQLLNLSGDRGAIGVFHNAVQRVQINFSDRELLDIDTVDDLKFIEENYANYA